MSTPDLPFTDSARSLLYRFSEPADQTQLDLIDSSFETDKIFQIKHQSNDCLSDGIGFGFSITEAKLQKSIHKYFPNDELDDPEDEEDENNFTLVVEDTNTFRPEAPPDPAASRTSLAHYIVAFIAVRFSAWNSRLTIADIEIRPTYRRQGIGRNLIGFAERIACSRFSIRQMWLEVSNVNYPAIRSYLTMGFVVAGFDTSLYTATEAQGEFAIFMWKQVT